MSKKNLARVSDPNQLEVASEPGDSRAQALAQTAIRPTVQAALTLQQYGQKFDGLDLTALVDALSDQTKAVNESDLGRAEAMLAAQAHTLDAIFNNLARRAALNMGEYLDATDRYLRLALRAQSQACRTWEVVSAIQNPPIANYVRQANIAGGHQQVNNEGARTRAVESTQIQLSGGNDELRSDTRTSGVTSQVDPPMETVGAEHRAKDRRG